MSVAEAPVRPRAALFVSGPAKLMRLVFEGDSLLLEDTIGESDTVRAYYARMAARFRSMPRPAHHEHGPTGEILPF